MQDKKGYLWIATENGLCLYNGNSLKIFNKENGLPEASVYDMREDENGAIWLLTSAQRILKVKDTMLKEQKISKKFTDVFKPSSRLAYRFSTDDNKNYIISTEKDTYSINRHTSSITNLTLHNPYKSEANYIIVTDSGQDYIIRNKAISTVFSAQKSYNISIDLITKSGNHRIVVPVQKSVVPDWRIKLCKSNGVLFFNINNMLIRVDQDFNYKIYTLPGNVLSLQSDRQNGLWVGCFQKGLYYFADIKTMQQPKKSLTEYSVTGTTMDKEGGVWCTTLEKGMFYCNNKDLTDYSDSKELSKKATLLKSIEGDVYVATGYESYLIIKNDGIIRQELNLKNSEFTDIINFKNKFYLANKGYVAQLDSHYKLQKHIRDFGNYDISTNQLAVYKNKLYAISPSTLFEISSRDSVKRINPYNTLKIRCVLPYSDSIVLVGSTYGLYKFNLQQEGNFVKIPGFNSVVTKIIRTLDNQLLIATRGEGIKYFENGHLHPFISDDIVNTALINDIIDDAEGNIWAGSSSGVFKILKSNGKVTLYTTSNGLLSNNVNKITINNKSLFMSTTEGLCTMPLDRFVINSVPPPIYLSSITVNNQPVNAEGKLQFPYFKNNITATFDVLAFKNEGLPKLLYTFKNSNEPLRATSQNKLVFENLTPDKYELIVYGVNSDGVRSLHPIILKFEIKKPFWLTYWFIGICMLGAGLLSLLIIRKRTRTIREEEENKSRISKLISESQLSALQAQMNPHFIFNAINSIQSYILKNDEAKAYDYLSKFSSLIRMVLNNSRESILSLDRELQTLALYIELEQLRFKNSFDYVLKVDENLDTQDIQIPSMLIQPYVENSIWHGLMSLNQQRKGILKIIIEEEYGMIKIVIEDNGIGRKQAEHHRKNDLHKPVAMGITNKRLSIIRKMHDYEKTRVEISDISSLSGETCGTKVILYLPLINADAN